MIYVLAATFLFSFGPILVRMGLNAGLDPTQLMVLRLSVAFPIFLVTVAVAGKVKQVAMPPRRLLFLLAYSAATMGGSMYSFFHAVYYLGASVTTLIGATTPVITALMAYLFLSQPLRKGQAASMAMSFGGAALLIVPVVGVGKIGSIIGSSYAGLGWVLLANTCASAAAIGFEKYLSEKEPLVSAFFVTGSMFLIFAPVFGWPGFALGLKLWVIVLLLGSVTWFVPFILLFKGFQEIGASNAVLVQNTGPLVTVSAAGFLLGEKLQLVQFVGMALILSSVLLLKFMGKREEAVIS